MSSAASPCPTASLLSVAAGLLAVTPHLARGASEGEAPPQREWTYEESADIVSGQPYPAAFLMSPKPASTSAKDSGVGHGYLTVGNYAKRPMEVTLNLDEPSTREREAKCKPGGCDLSVRFGTSAALNFVAVQDRYGSRLVLQDARPLIAAAARHVGPVDVQVQTLNYGTVAVRFATATRLQPDKLTSPKR